MSASSTFPLLSVEHLSVTFTQYSQGLQRRTLTPIADLSLSLSAGEVLAVIGASGSGKSLLAQAVLGILPYNATAAGCIRYQGQILTPSEQARLRGRQLALVPQNVSFLDPLLRVGEQVRSGDNSPAARQRCRQVLASLGLGPEVEALFPFQLSGGMARRVLIATALMIHPRLVIADEPTPGLHPAAARQVLGHFHRLAEEGAAVLLISHDLPAALTVAQRVAVLYEGRMIEEASAAAFTAPATLQHPYTRALAAAWPGRGFQAPSGPWPYDEASPATAPEDEPCF